MDIPQDMQNELTKLREAVDGRKAEAICLAYMALRKSASENHVGGEEMFALADRALSRPVVNVIISAFAHRHCPMCQDGMVECGNCETTGIVDTNRSCPDCDGIGMVSCDFCQGTGWAPPDMLVPEVTPEICKKQQLVDVEKDLRDLKPIMVEFGREKRDQLTSELRHNLQKWTMRLRARLNSLIQDEDLGLSAEEKNRLLGAVGELDAYLTMLRGVHVSE